MAIFGVWMWPKSVRVDGADAVVSRCKRAGVTDIYFLTKGLSGTASCRSDIVPMDCERDLLGELGDKISADEKASIQSAVDNLKEVNKGTDIEAIKAATDAVQKAFYAVSEKLYQQAAPQGDCGGDCGNCGDDGVVDADYETVD